MFWAGFGGFGSLFWASGSTPCFTIAHTFFRFVSPLFFPDEVGSSENGLPQNSLSFITIFPMQFPNIFFASFGVDPFPDLPEVLLAPGKAEKEEPAKEEPKVEARPGCDTEVCKLLTVEYCKPLVLYPVLSDTLFSVKP